MFEKYNDTLDPFVILIFSSLVHSFCMKMAVAHNSKISRNKIARAQKPVNTFNILSHLIFCGIL